MSAIRISQVVAFSRTLSVHLNPRIEGTEIVCPQFSGGRFCQVVARTGSTVVVDCEWEIVSFVVQRHDQLPIANFNLAV